MISFNIAHSVAVGICGHYMCMYMYIKMTHLLYSTVQYVHALCMLVVACLHTACIHQSLIFMYIHVYICTHISTKRAPTYTPRAAHLWPCGRPAIPCPDWSTYVLR